MASLAVTMKGELLAHLGVKSGARIELDKLPGDELRAKRAQSAGTIDSFIGRHGQGGKTLGDRRDERNRRSMLGRRGIEITVDTNILARAVQGYPQQGAAAAELLREQL